MRTSRIAVVCCCVVLVVVVAGFTQGDANGRSPNVLKTSVDPTFLPVEAELSQTGKGSLPDRAAAATTILEWFTFDSGGSGDTEGWTTQDMTGCSFTSMTSRGWAAAARACWSRWRERSRCGVVRVRRIRTGVLNITIRFRAMETGGVRSSGRTDRSLSVATSTYSSRSATTRNRDMTC